MPICMKRFENLKNSTVYELDNKAYKCIKVNNTF